MRSRLPPLDQLHAFALVAQSGSLTAAAAALNVTQPAVSRRLRELEAALGVALLRRGANAVALTEAGAAYAAELSRGFAVISAATEALSRRPAPPIRIRAYTTWAMRWLIPRLPAFQAQHPGLSVEVLSSMRPQVDFLREGIDAAIRAAPENAPPMPGAIPLQRVLVAPFAAPALARAATADGLPPPGVALLGSRARPRDWQVWAAARGLPAPPSAPSLFASTSLALQAAIEGLGVVIAPPVFVEADAAEGRLVRLAGDAAATGDRYWLLLPPRARPEVAGAFAGWLARAASEDEP
ncbi:MAG: LysR family transcriptional regulator [Acetobacteraceae bacterium]